MEMHNRAGISAKLSIIFVVALSIALDYHLSDTTVIILAILFATASILIFLD